MNGLLIWSRKTDLNQLQKLQNRAARIVSNSSYDAPSKPLLQKLEWKTMLDLIGDETKMMVFKSLNDLDHNTCITCSPKIQTYLSANLETPPLI